ncbi:ATP12 family chaperone protein [Anianabacter salinae]|uniref:ATP12 family chaperone protein n=1 Tax=Anianabacter salinae TaxID=2851023 RepID=UPI00225E6004|nr:ATP12 family protein [Anianabacter salinae]MBV0913119.1 ATPase [Anianabacter salinae]
MSEWKLRRFWKAAAVEADAEGYRIVLDGRPVRTPAKAPLVVPSAAFAEEIRAEWEAQGDEIQPLTMPATRAANAAIDRVAPQQAEVAQMLASYGDADLTCYRAGTPAELAERQAAAWDPLLDWAHDRYGARLIPVQGVMHAPQAPGALGRLAAPLHAMTAFELTAAHDLISLSGSLVIGLAATEELHPPERLWDLSRIDEDWQAELWGADEEAQALSDERRDAFLNAARFFHMVAKKT